VRVSGVSIWIPRPSSSLGFGDEEVHYILVWFRSNGSDSSGVHPTAKIHRAT
jgi:hypothetical protein